LLAVLLPPTAAALDLHMRRHHKDNGYGLLHIGWQIDFSKRRNCQPLLS